MAQRLGWKHPPLTSFRLKNLTGDNIADMEPVSRIVGEMPYTVEEGVEFTVDWMRREGWIPWAGRVPMVDPPLPRLFPVHVRLQTGLPEGT